MAGIDDPLWENALEKQQRERSDTVMSKVDDEWFKNFRFDTGKGRWIEKKKADEGMECG